MTMKIGMISSTQKTEDEYQRRLAILNKLVAGKAQLEIIPSGCPLKQLQTEEDHRVATPFMVEAAKREEGRFGAYIIGCLGDAGYYEIRRATTTPVIPPARTTYMMAATMFERILVLTNNAQGAEVRKKIFAEMGIDRSLSEIMVTGSAPLDYVQKPDESLDKVERLLRERKDSNARAFIPTCASLAILLEQRGIQNLAGMKMVNPLRIAIRVAEVIAGH